MAGVVESVFQPQLSGVNQHAALQQADHWTALVCKNPARILNADFF